jgi:CrcB protein
MKNIVESIFCNSVMLLTVGGASGGYTTFSTFSLETLKLLQENRVVLAAANVIASVLGGLIAVWVGLRIAKG